MSASPRSPKIPDPGPPPVDGPRRLWYGVGAAVAVLAVVAAVALIASGVSGFLDEVDDFQRVPIGEEGRVVFAETGGYTVYYEGPGADDVEFRSPGIEVEIAPVDGRPLSLSEYDSDVTYTVNGDDGRALYSFEIDEPGSYVVRSDSRFGEVGDIAVGRGLGRRLVGPVVGGIALGVWGLGTGIGILALTALRRRDARRRAAQAAPPMIR